MSDPPYVTNEELLEAVRNARKKGTYPGYASWESIRQLLPNAPGLLDRLREMASAGILKMSFGWKNYAKEDIVGIDPAVGFNNHDPLFDVL